MNTERFIIFLLLAGLVYLYFFGPPQINSLDSQRISQPPPATAVYHIDTSAPATVTYLTPVWPTSAPVIVPTAAPIPTGTPTPLQASSNGEGQRSEQGNERSCRGNRNCGDE